MILFSSSLQLPAAIATSLTGKHGVQQLHLMIGMTMNIVRGIWNLS